MKQVLESICAPFIRVLTFVGPASLGHMPTRVYNGIKRVREPCLNIEMGVSLKKFNLRKSVSFV